MPAWQAAAVRLGFQSMPRQCWQVLGSAVSAVGPLCPEDMGHSALQSKLRQISRHRGLLWSPCNGLMRR